jgi:hypothetical protein
MQENHDLKCLDDLIADIGGADYGMQTVGPSGLLLEHLEAARRGLLGSMRAEYNSSLEQAKESLGCVADKGRRSEMRSILRGLIASES